MAKKMLIDATHPEETRVVVVDGNKVDDFDYESVNKRQLAGNIYLAKVTRVEPSLQAAFVEYGGNRHGFLAFAEVHPDYYQIPVADREALLAEEEREEEERRNREEERDVEATKPAKARGRGRGRRSRKSETEDDADAQAATVVAGLEVIDVDDDEAPASPDAENSENAVPRGLEIAGDDPDKPSSEDAAEASAVKEPDGVDSDETTPPTAEAPVAAEAPSPEAEESTASESTDQQDVAAAPNTPAEPADAAEDDTNPEPTVPPRSIAESAGLDDEDRVTEEIVDADASRKTVSDDKPEASDQAEQSAEAPEAAAPEQTATDAASDQAPDPASDTETSDQGVPAQAAESAPDEATAEAGGETPAAEDKPERAPRKPRRKRRSKAEKKEEEEAKAAESNGSDDQDGEENDELESIGAEDTLEEAAHARVKLRRRYKIQDVIKVRQILLVQVVKEERGNKGAALTTYLSLAGRYCVLMPNTARGGGISRKITNAPDRKRLREITSELDVPKGMGLIVRTAGAERTRPEIKRDYEFLIRQWEQIRELTLKSVAPAQIYEEGSLIKRSIRDIYSKEIDQIQVEGEVGYREAKEYMKMLMPSHAKNVQPYTDQIPLFTRFQVESYLNGMFNPTVQLKSGGYIVIDVTEALVAVDVNSGRATKQGSIEETALQTNLEAAEEVARQLRLRDLAGLIVIDFIDMDENRNNRAVEKRMKDRLKNDRARIQVGRISAFGLMEMSRQRLRPGMLEATTQPCPHCLGVGLIRSDDSLALSILREVEEEGVRNRASEISVRAPIDIANYLINNKRDHISQIEARHGITINVLADPSLISPKFEIERSKTQTRRPAQGSTAITSASVVTDAEMAEAQIVAEETDGGDDTPQSEDEGRSRRRSRRRGGKGRNRNADDQAQTDSNDTEQDSDQDADQESGRTEDGDEEKRPRSRRSRGGRRRSRGRRGERSEGGETPENGDAANGATTASDDAVTAAAMTDEAPASPAPAEAAATSTTDSVSEAVTAPAESDAAPAEVEATPVEVATVTPEPILETKSVPEQTVEQPSADPAVESEEVGETDVAVIDEEQPATQPEPEPEPVSAPEDAAPKPKKRGWWSFGG